jgi:hypothetical protein
LRIALTGSLARHRLQKARSRRGCAAAGWCIFWHLVEMLQKPEYQFLVVLPLAAWALSSTLEFGQIAPRRRPLFALITAFVSCAGGLAAAWFWSPWAGTVSALIAVIPCLWWAGGWPRVRDWMPVWILCWLVVRLPFGWDQRLIQYLRTVTTRLASGVLEEIGILHLSYANVIELPGKPLFVADACSGINSLHVLLGAALALVVATFGLVMIENVSRLVAVAAGVRWKIDLSEGPKHAALGYALFGISLLLMVSTDQLLMFLSPAAKTNAASTASSPAAYHRSLGQGFVRRVLGAAWAATAIVIGFLGVTNCRAWVKTFCRMSWRASNLIGIPRSSESLAIRSVRRVSNGSTAAVI